MSGLGIIIKKLNSNLAILIKKKKVIHETMFVLNYYWITIAKEKGLSARLFWFFEQCYRLFWISRFDQFKRLLREWFTKLPKIHCALKSPGRSFYMKILKTRFFGNISNSCHWVTHMGLVQTSQPASSKVTKNQMPKFITWQKF